MFGSVLCGEDAPDSDVDLLRMAELELELGAVLGWEIELRTYEDLSGYFRDDVRSQACVLYAAWMQSDRGVS